MNKCSICKQKSADHEGPFINYKSVFKMLKNEPIERIQLEEERLNRA